MKSESLPMDNEVENFTITRITPEGRVTTDDPVVREFPLTIILNGDELVTMLCSPEHLDWLAVGFLSSEGLLADKNQLKNVITDNQRGIVRVDTSVATASPQDIVFKRVITTGCGRGASFYSAADATSQKVTSKTEITPPEIFNLVDSFQHYSELYITTHGVHSAALCDNEKILIFQSDIGRHNALDKIFGKCLLDDIQTADRVVITSGRVSSEILHKVAKKEIPILVSISAPTNLGVRLAESLGITLIGRVRGNRRMNIYTHDWRVA